MAVFDEIDGTLDALFADTLVPGLVLTRPLAFAWNDGAAGDPASGTVSGGTPRSVSTTAVPREWTTYERAANLFRAGDAKVLAQGKAFAATGEPPEGATATWEGKTWRLRATLGRKILQGGTLVLAFHLQVP